MALVRWNPYRELSTWNRDWNRFIDNVFGNGEDFVAGSWSPRVDIHEDENAIVVSAALPGMDQDEIKVNLENDTLTISGERKIENEEHKDKYTRVEQYYGSFCRSFTLPNTVDQEKIDAKMDKGVLKITLPKREETKPRSIEVKVK